MTPWTPPPCTYGVNSCQQEFSDAAQNLRDRHLLAEQEVCEVGPLHVLTQVHLVVNLLHFLLHQPFSYCIKKHTFAFATVNNQQRKWQLQFVN